MSRPTTSAGMADRVVDTTASSDRTPEEKPLPEHSSAMIRASVENVDTSRTIASSGRERAIWALGLSSHGARVRGYSALGVAMTSRLTVMTIPRRFRPRMCPTTAIRDIGCPVATADCGTRGDCSAAHESSHHVRWHGRSRGWHHCIVRPHTGGKTAARALGCDDCRKC